MNVATLERWASDGLGLPIFLETAKGSELSDTWSQAPAIDL